MKNILNSKWFTLIIFLFGLLPWAIIYPSLYSPNGWSIYYLVGSFLCFFISFYLGILHFFWVREKKPNGMKRFWWAFVKSFGLFLFLLVAFNVYQYFYGHMYGGRYYQSKAFVAEAKINLAEYYRKQKDYYGKNNAYSVDLHTSQFKGVTSFKYGTAVQDLFIKKHCLDCFVTPSNFKIAAYGAHQGQIYFLTIDEKAASARDFKLKVIPKVEF